MKTVARNLFFFLACCLSFGPASAGAPTCSANNGNPYCQYSGKVKKAYVNSLDEILLYFDTPLDLSLPAAVGITGISWSFAAAVRVSADESFAKFFYSTILTAQARGATVTVQMRGSVNNYLAIDRIWINQ